MTLSRALLITCPACGAQPLRPCASRVLRGLVRRPHIERIITAAYTPPSPRE